jgi:hypothetical protein
MLVEKKDSSKLLGMIIIYTRHGGFDLVIPVQNKMHKRAVIEAIELALSYLFLEFDRKNNVSVWIPSWNTWLINIVKENGMKSAGRERRVGMRNGKFFDNIVFDLTKDEYLKQKQPK